MDAVNRGLKLNSLNSNLERYLKDLDKNDKEYALVEEISKLTKEELDRHMELQKDWFAKKFTPDKDLEPVKSAEQIAIDKAQLDQVMNQDEDKPEEKKEDAEKKDPDKETEVKNEEIKAGVNGKTEKKADEKTEEPGLSDDAIIFDSSKKSKKKKSGRSAEKNQEATADSVIKGLDDNEQFTGTREYSKILKTYKSLVKAEKLLNEELSVSDIKENDKKLYEQQMAELLKQKKDLAVDMDKYIERKNTEKENAKSAGKKENVNSRKRRRAMEAARDFLKKDIETVEKEKGVESDKLFENVVNNLEYGNRLTKGKKAYNDILDSAKELASKPKEYSSIKKEAELVDKMQEYLSDKAKDLKGKKGYEFSINGGKDGKRPPKNNKEKRFLLMLDSMKEVMHRLIEDVEKFKPKKIEEVTTLLKETDRKFGTELDRELKPYEAKSYSERQEINEIKFDKRKTVLVNNLMKGYKEATEKKEKFEFPRALGNVHVEKVINKAEEILYDDIMAKQGAEYNDKTYKSNIKIGVYKLGAHFVNAFEENLRDKLDPSKNTPEEIAAFRMDKKTLKQLETKSVEDAMSMLVVEANSNYKENKDLLSFNVKLMDELVETAKKVGAEEVLDKKKFTYKDEEKSFREIIEGVRKDAELQKEAGNKKESNIQNGNQNAAGQKNNDKKAAMKK